MTNLPQPVTVTEMYLAAILDELHLITLLVSKQTSNKQPGDELREPAGVVELKEPKKKAEAK